MADGDITSDEYMKKLDDFVSRRTLAVKGLNNQYQMRACYDKAAQFYKKPVRKTGKTKNKKENQYVRTLTIKNLYNHMDETIAKDIFEGANLPMGNPSKDQRLHQRTRKDPSGR